MYHIVYQTTNIINNRIYIGVHETDDHLLFDGYLGSGYLLMKAVKKYGVENFKRETLFVFETTEQAYTKERELVNEEFILREDTYNVTVGGKIPPNHRGKPKSEEHKRKISEAQKGKVVSDETKQKIKKARIKQTIVHSEETKQKIGAAHRGKTVSEETKQKLSMNHADVSGENNPMYGKYGEMHPKFGKVLSFESRQKIREAALAHQENITCPFCGKEGKRAGMLRWHFDNCRLRQVEP